MLIIWIKTVDTPIFKITYFEYISFWDIYIYNMTESTYF